MSSLDMWLGFAEVTTLLEVRVSFIVLVVVLLLRTESTEMALLEATVDILLSPGVYLHRVGK